MEVVVMGAEKKQFKKALQNRDLSWIQFNERILDEADNLYNPLLERAKFLAIVTSNMDEFFQVRYHSIFENGYEKTEDEHKGMGGLTPHKLYKKVTLALQEQYKRQYVIYDGIRGELYRECVRIFPAFFRDTAMVEEEVSVFTNEILPQLQVEPIEKANIQQKQLYICVKLSHEKTKKASFMIIGLPSVLKRLYVLSEIGDVKCIIRLEDIVKHHIQQLFPKDIVEYCAMFRILRNQDFEVREEKTEDIVPAVRKMIEKRNTGKPMRIEVEESMSEEMLTLLMREMKVVQEQTIRAAGPLDLNKLMMSLYSIVDRPDLKYDVVKPVELPELMGEDIFEKIEQKDRLMFHPYHSFEPVLNLINRAAEDADVTAIKMVLYRVSKSSPIIDALIRAAKQQKNVFVLFEAHARFDEENNLRCGEMLEKAGCKVIYGVPNLKVHSKITLIEKNCGEHVKHYLHLGTGNYNEGTAKLYTDFGLLTANEQLGRDAVAFFEQFEGKDIPM